MRASIKYIFLIFVAVLLRLKRSREAFNELMRELLFLILQLDLVGWNGLSRTNLIRIEHGVQRHTLRARPDNHDVFALMHGELGDRPVAGLLHRIGKKLVSLQAGILRVKVIR